MRIVTFSQQGCLSAYDTDHLDDNFAQSKGFDSLKDLQLAYRIRKDNNQPLNVEEYRRLISLQQEPQYQSLPLENLLQNRTACQIIQGGTQRTYTLSQEEQNKLNDSLWRSVLNNNVDQVRFFLEQGANPALKNSRGKNIYHIALDNGYYDIFTLIMSFKDPGVLSQSPILHILRNLGYKDSPGGTCLGIASVAIHKYLSNDIQSFDALFKKILYLDQNNINILADHNTPIDTSIRISNGETITKLELMEFLDSINLHQKWRDHNKDLFMSYMSFYTSKSEQNYISHIASFTGKYNRNDLTLFFNTLANNCTKSFSLLFSSEIHVINISFNPKTRTWTVVDANYLPIISIPQDNLTELVNNITDKYFNSSDYLGYSRGIFGVNIFSLGSTRHILTQNLSVLKNNPNWIQLHDLSSKTTYDLKALFHTSYVTNDYSTLYKSLTILGENTLRDSLNGKINTDLFGQLLLNTDKLMVLFLAWEKISSEKLTETKIESMIKRYGITQEPSLASLINTYVANPDKELISLVEYASKQHSPDLIKVIIDSQPDGFNIDECLEFRGSHKTPLMHSASNFIRDQDGYLTTRYLLDEGAEPNIQNRHGCTALHFAAYAGNWKAIQLLKDRGADIHIVDNYGNTPKMLAEQRGYGQHIIDLLN